MRVAIKEIFTPHDKRDTASLYHIIEYIEDIQEYHISSAFYDFEEGLEDIIVVLTIRTNGDNLFEEIAKITNKELLKSLYFCGAVRCL